MSSIKKFWLGVFTFLPIILFIVYLTLFFTLFLNTIHQHDNGHHDEFPIQMIRMIFITFLPLIISFIISLILTIYYIVDANNNPQNDTGKKIMWTVILIFVSTLGCIVYYFVEILPERKTQDIKSVH